MNKIQSMHCRSKMSVRRLTTLSISLGIILIIGLVERSIPLDFVIPGVKLGLSNVVVLTLLYCFKPSEVYILVVLKCVITAIAFGSAASFIYSISGSTLSFFIMTALVYFSYSRLSIIGISVTGAVFHNIGQIIAGCFVLGTTKIVAMLPILLVSGVVTGVLVGICSKRLVTHLKKLQIIGFC